MQSIYGMVMTAFGIVAIVTSVLGIITPTLGLLLSGLSGFFALFSLRYKDPFAQASLVLNCLNLTLLSPLTVASIFSDYALFAKTTQNLKIMYWLILFIQSIGLVLWFIYSKEDDAGETAQLVDKPKERIEPRL